MSTDPNLPASGAGVEPCAGCGAPLAADQRYCLHCGERRAAARIEFLDALEAESEPRRPAAAAPPEGLDGQLRANGPAIALGVLLVGMLLAGLLVGHWATSDPPAPKAAPPQVIRIAGDATATTAPATAAPPSTTPAAGGPAAGGTGSGSGG